MSAPRKTPRLDRRMVLEAPDRVADGAGGFQLTWVVRGVLWAALTPGAGREAAGVEVVRIPSPGLLTRDAGLQARAIFGKWSVTGVYSERDSGERATDPTRVYELVEQPAKVMRIGTMIKQLLDEVRSAPLDEAGRARLKEIHRRSIAG